jgi:catechol 2,3-dioxygenase-like lactoylglutathione lyase family enzyme
MGQKKYVDSTEQLVTEIVIRNIQRSTKFYRELGFKVLRDAGDFVELTWEDHQLYIAELSAYHEINSEEIELPYPPKFPIDNIRIMVPNVDHYWNLVKEMGAHPVHFYHLVEYDNKIRTILDNCRTNSAAKPNLLPSPFSHASLETHVQAPLLPAICR